MNVWDQAYEDQSTPWSKDSWQVNDWAKISPGKDVLDLGCGDGSYAEKFEKMGFNVVGLDNSSKAISLAKAKSPNSKFIQYDLEDLTNFQSDIQYDLIIDVKVFAFIQDKLAYLKAIKRLLKPKGIFILQFFIKHQDSSLIVRFDNFPFIEINNTVVENKAKGSKLLTYFFTQ